MFEATRLAILTVGLLVVLGGAVAQSQTKEWRPDEELVAHADSLALRFKLPKGFGIVSSYQRYYWGMVTTDGHPLVEGFVVSPQADYGPFPKERGLYFSRPVVGRNRPSEIHIVRESEVRGVKGGGCAYISLESEVESKKLDISCNAPM